MGKDEAWIHSTLQEKGAELQDTWLLTLEKGGRVYFVRKEREE